MTNVLLQATVWKQDFDVKLKVIFSEGSFSVLSYYGKILLDPTGRN